jgi:hypothetical protein
MDFIQVAAQTPDLHVLFNFLYSLVLAAFRDGEEDRCLSAAMGKPAAGARGRGPAPLLLPAPRCYMMSMRKPSHQETSPGTAPRAAGHAPVRARRSIPARPRPRPWPGAPRLRTVRAASSGSRLRVRAHVRGVPGPALRSAATGGVAVQLSTTGVHWLRLWGVTLAFVAQTCLFQISPQLI